MTITITFAEATGCRASHEDRHAGFLFSGRGYRAWILGVFDGHGGFAVADLCERALFRIPVPEELPDPEGFLREFVSRLDGETRSYHEGSTLSIALIVRRPDGKETVSIAVLGDSPVIVLDRFGFGRLHVGPDHNIRSNPEERRAVIARGGTVENGYVYPPACEYGLQMSRALGDSWMGDILSREPELLTVEDPAWVLVASDGIFDPSHTEMGLPEGIRDLAERGASAHEALAWAHKWAGRTSLRDNATAVVWSKRGR